MNTTSRQASKPPAPVPGPAGAGAKAGETRPAPGGTAGPEHRASGPATTTTRGTSTSPAGAVSTATGSKAAERKTHSSSATPPASPGTNTGDLVAPTARLVLPKDAPQHEWHTVRRTGLGGRDIAAVVGLDGWSSPMEVYEDKHGRGGADSMPTYVGRKIRPVISEIFGELSGLPLADMPGTIQHVTRPWMLATIDVCAVEPDGALAPVECQNRSWRDAAAWEHGTPDAPALRTLWYLATGGYDHGYATALTDDTQIRWYRIERDEELIAHLIQWCGDWWQRHIVQGTRPRPDGSPATTELLAHLWDVMPGSTAEVDPLMTAGLLEEETRLQAGIKALNNQLSRVQNRLCAQLGGAEVATVSGRPAYTWRPTGAFDEDAFRRDQPELAAEYLRPVEHTDTARLAADHPEVYRQYIDRQLYVPPKGSPA
jgi:predicted phage-related endonuclease